MDVERSNQFGALDEMRLVRFEKEIGHRLPADYRAFLLAHNGGRPNPSDFFFPGERDAFDTLHHTYGLHDGPDYFRLDIAYESHKEFIPTTLVPFADDPGGNAYCIGIAGKHSGKVYFWNHEMAWSPEGLRLLANSFTEFLQSLKSADEA
jgi:cell wall assembly regulator SMI1